ARAELEHAESAFRDAREALEEASRRVASLRGDLELQRTRQDLAQWKRRREQVQAASRAVDEVREKLRANPLDEAAVRAVQQAERAVDRARTRVETEGPLLQLTPQVPLQATLDGRGVTLEAGETVEHRVAESLLLSLPGVADLTLVAGAGAAERVKVLEQAKTRFRECCAAWGVDDHADAVRTFAAREEAERRLAEHEQLLRDALGDETPDGLDARVAALEARRDTLEAERADLFPAPPDTDAAQALLDESEQAHERARADFDDAGRRRDALVGRHRQLSEQHRETAVRLELAQRSFGDLDERLAAARAEASDDSLREEQELRSARARQFEKTASDASEALAALDPEGTEARLSRARHQREQRARELARVHDEATEVAARLQVRGEAGLYEHVETARAEADRAERHARSLARRAAAAKRLLETLRAERDATRDGYAEPLVRRIEELGALVFDDGFAVELDDELRVARRILHGTSLRFDQLSAGAREQIALLARLAVATLVASDGGAPLVIDDALGHSDPQRLARIGRALGAAAPHCQIVVLTCTPDRYRHVESAHAVQLG
ncbi:MAG: ATP-binding protein, partial [Myxococcota bacterium]